MKARAWQLVSVAERAAFKRVGFSLSYKESIFLGLLDNRLISSTFSVNLWCGIIYR